MSTQRQTLTPQTEHDGEQELTADKISDVLDALRKIKRPCTLEGDIWPEIQTSMTEEQGLEVLELLVSDGKVIRKTVGTRTVFWITPKPSTVSPHRITLDAEDFNPVPYFDTFHASAALGASMAHALFSRETKGARVHFTGQPVDFLFPEAPEAVHARACVLRPGPQPSLCYLNFNGDYQFMGYTEDSCESVHRKRAHQDVVDAVLEADWYRELIGEGGLDLEVATWLNTPFQEAQPDPRQNATHLFNGVDGEYVMDQVWVMRVPTDQPIPERQRNQVWAMRVPTDPPISERQRNQVWAVRQPEAPARRTNGSRETHGL
ncbi:hypothetical protein M408DRAFT_20850 [Serendipita vermifera MAFF 305830]|uniref:Uncharacterized protein n=1 Tax=Serendipita vermifera MAFF 305830 TaxID=933852 RepID=A0A0C3B489_SERVB|nr:hypothetical protein M408DRAFT_20850 [Serendipita vermifera MAFF 305830]